MLDVLWEEDETEVTSHSPVDSTADSSNNNNAGSRYKLDAVRTLNQLVANMT